MGDSLPEAQVNKLLGLSLIACISNKYSATLLAISFLYIMLQNYTIYLNNIVVLLVQHKHTFNIGKNNDSVIYFCSKKSEVEKIITAVEIGSIKTNLILVADDLDWLQETFFSFFKIIIAGGGLVKNKEGEYLMIFRKGKWDLPKGKIEKGEDVKSGAIREVEEETGVEDISLDYKLGKTYHTYQLKDKWVLKESHWYAMRSSFEGELVPQEIEGIKKAEWVSRKQIKQLLKNSYPSIKEVFKMR